jgi:hypothetical protein
MTDEPVDGEHHLPADEDQDERLGPYPINWHWIEAETRGSMFDAVPAFDTFDDQELQAKKQQLADELLDLFTDLATRLKEEE